MKKLVTFRIDSALLDAARRAAEAENRTLTNFVETVLKHRLNTQLDRDRPAGDPINGNERPGRSEGGGI